MATTVYFATNRNPILTGIENNFGTDFNASASPVSFGKAVLKRTDDEQDLRQSNMDILPPTAREFSAGLTQEILSGPDRLMIHIHGFDYRFREAVMRTAVFKRRIETAQHGRPTTLILFSWPSRGSFSPSSYRDDIAAAGNSSAAFTAFFAAVVRLIARYRRAKPGGVVSITAHSLGNYALTRGIAAAIGSNPGQYDPRGAPALFDNAQLYAADTDADALSAPDKLGSLGLVAARIVNYYNRQDLPLRTISSWVNRFDRLGLQSAPNMPAFKGSAYEFVNCSAAIARDASDDRDDSGNIRDWQRHQYYYLVDEVCGDIAGVMAGIAAADLPNRTYRSRQNYYRLDLAD